MFLTQENYTERTRYIQELQKILRDRSLLGEGNEEMDIRVALLDLDRQVSQYCKSNNITSPPHARTGPQVQIKVGVYVNVHVMTMCVCYKKSQMYVTVSLVTGIGVHYLPHGHHTD